MQSAILFVRPFVYLSVGVVVLYLNEYGQTFHPIASLHAVTKFLDEPLNLTVGVKRMGVQKLRISIEIAVFSVTERDRPIVTMDH